MSAPRPLHWTIPTLALGLASCLSARPGPSDWQEIGFRTPEQTFHTYVTAFATDQLDLEYRCLSSGFKERNQIGGYTYRVVRDRLEDEIPGFGFLARAEVRGRNAVDDAHVALVARVGVAWIERWFLVELVREDYFALFRDGELYFDGFAPFDAEHLSIDTRWDPDRLWAAIDLDDPLGELDLEDPTQLSEVTVGREWKIDNLEPLTPEQAAERLSVEDATDLGPSPTVD